jgi:hypothetical protein
MAKAYRVSSPFNVAMKLLIPVDTKVKGTTKKVFPEPSTVDQIIFGSFRTFGGTENFSNDVFTIESTGIINTWYDPSITADCRIYICDTGETWEVLGRPEDINMQHQFMQIKVKQVGGKP